MEAKWTGPCKPDMRPGDVIFPSGIKSNAADVPEFAGDRAFKSKGQSGDKGGKGKAAPADSAAPTK
jgi:hypothetical protein